ncbi:bifunctional 2-polyprenyl-6-hydroxyphenol methylase/3-demethylubiquinol 3-O-methyltransferase UbiG [Azovibrio restrictus]|uniref:class I SAM-dependent methyltransferase n=1 Tax=Azovibrio restrictus TaxID=146938 RepID=UPI0026F0D12C|nr:class I SAM-dependent methyltransferase [Azovibrio restrictus]
MTIARISSWLARHAERLPPGSRVLDLACGQGGHSRWLAARGHRVVAVDRDGEALAGLAGVPGVMPRQLELEGEDWPLAGESYDLVLVSRYLYRPRLDALVQLLAPGGLLIYETFMTGHERFGRPSRPDFLLQPGELLELARRNGLFVIAFEQGETEGPARMQRLCASRDPAGHGVRL